MLVTFERTVARQRVRTLMDLCSMSIEPYTTQCYRDGRWDKVETDELLPGDVASLGEWLYSLKEFLY